MMRICELNTGAGRLQRAASDLKERWVETKEHWSDRNCQKFEEEFLHPLAPILNQLAAAIRTYAEVMEGAEQALSDPDREETFL